MAEDTLNKEANIDDYQLCKRCVMDTSAPDIRFDEHGFCNYGHDFLRRAKPILDENPDKKREKLSDLVDEIKKKSKGKPYDCIVGVSGGVDSSWVLVKAVELGLRPLAVHMDNGWNSELAQNNIERLIKKLDVDLYTYVIDWNEFRDLQESFFNSDVVDIELLTDNALVAINYQQARKYGIKYIISGSNTATEGVRMPSTWAAVNKYDKKNILKIWKKFGKGYPLTSFPIYSTVDAIIDTFIRKIQWVRFLDLLDYKKSVALDVLSSEYGYIPYPYKHYESVFTRMYQGIILPEKFNVDKRRNHLSALILSGDMTRDEALKLLESIPYSNEKERDNDLDYFLKKFKWDAEQFEEYIQRPPKPHEAHGTELLMPKLYQIIDGLRRRVNGFR